MSTKMDSVSAYRSARGDPQGSSEADNSAGRAGRPPTTGPQLATVDVVAGGTVAVTRPGMPRIFRLLLALTGVRV
jgi:hypothetical protein